MATSCPVTTLDATWRLEVHHPRPAGIDPYGRENISRTSIERWRQPAGPQLFAPTNDSAPMNPQRSWIRHIWASQFPEDCSKAKYLLFEDDLASQGAGYTHNFYTALLLMAMMENRVLVEVPVDADWKPYGAGNASQIIWNTSHYYSRTGHHVPTTQPRWCSRPPYTQACFYQPWSHCSIPRLAGRRGEHVGVRHAAAPHLHPRWPYVITLWPSPTSRVVRVKLSWIFCSWFLWQGKNSRASAAAARFLMRPLPWIREQSDCVLRRAGLAEHRFVSVHLRDSVEKRSELKAHGHSTPAPDAFHELASIAARVLSPTGPRVVVAHTSSAGALAALSSLARSSGTYSLAYTGNARTDHDEFGGWRSTPASLVNETVQGVIGAVNADLAARSAVLVTPSASAWSHMLVKLMGGAADPYDGDGLGSASPVPVPSTWVATYCCACTPREKRASMGNIDVVVSSAVDATTRERLIQTYLQAEVQGCQMLRKTASSSA